MCPSLWKGHLKIYYPWHLTVNTWTMSIGTIYSFHCGKLNHCFHPWPLSPPPHSTALSVGRSVDCLKPEQPLIMDTCTAPRTARRGEEVQTLREARCNRCSRTSIKIKYRILLHRACTKPLFCTRCFNRCIEAEAVIRTNEWQGATSVLYISRIAV